jgi:hypothetical protein
MIRSTTIHETDIASSQPLYQPVGGIAGAKPSKGDIATMLKTLSKRHSAGDLNGELAGKTVVIIGNSASIKKTRWSPLSRFRAIGCNRALLSKAWWPEYVMCADREVYCDVRDKGAFFRGTKVGVKLLLGNSLFDPTVILRGNAAGTPRPFLWAQPIPRFKFYRYEAGNRDKTWTYDDVIAGTVRPPYNYTDLGKPLVTGQTVLVSVLQAAVALGAKKIISIGFEVTWPAKGPTHFHTGKRRKKGCWPRSLSIIRTCLGHIKQDLADMKISLFNLSPVKDCLFAEVFGNHTYDEAL